MEKKFALEFEEEPVLVFVQHRLGDTFELYQDGEPVRGIREVNISAGYRIATEHEIKYLTGATK